MILDLNRLPFKVSLGLITIQIGEKADEKNWRVYVGFIDLEKVYDRVNKWALWQMLGMYDVDDKRLNGMKRLRV